MNFLSKILKIHHIFSKKMETFNEISLSKKALLNNFDVISKINTWKYVFPVLKSNAYGHGIQEIATILRERKTEYIVVDSYYEALKFWEVNPAKILLIGSFLETNISSMNFKKMDVVVYDTNILHALGKLGKKVSIHIKIDTGMNRQGLYPHELQDFLKIAKKYKKISIVGICTHLADADSSDNRYSEMQMHRFEHALDVLNEHKIFPKYVHLSNSAWSIKDFLSTRVNSVRLGISLYGVNPLWEWDTAYNKAQKLEGVLDFTSRLIQKKLLKAGEKVGYNGSFQAKNDMYIGVLPVGYFEGISRTLSNNYTFYYKNKPLPILGKVCMNLCMVDLSTIPSIKVGEKISIISSEKTAKNTINHMAKAAWTIPYETLVKLDESVRREIK